MRVLQVLWLLAVPLSAAVPTVKVQIAGPRGFSVVDMPLERYVPAVLAGECSSFRSVEALQAMAVAARTYAVRMRGRHAAEGFDLCSSTHCQRLDPASVTKRLEAAAVETAGELLWFQGKPAFTPYTKDCGGRTEDASSVWPDLAATYLKSHSDTYCVGSNSAGWNWAAAPRQILEALTRSKLRGPRTLDRITILNRTPSGRASVLVLAGGSESIRISAGSFRFAMGRELGWDTIRSDDFSVRASGNRLIFEGHGSGHGVGLCQYGAEQMGLAKRSYREILAYYYPGTVAGLTGRGLPWQRLSGETVALLTTEPDRDRVVLRAAERLMAALSRSTGWPPLTGTEILVYPDLETFRNATAEPGWVAAHTVGRRIHLQPIAVLRSKGVLDATLSHELLHVLVESEAKPNLPLWFREGLVEFLASRQSAGNPRIPSDAELRQTADASMARRAYADAAAMVASLVQRYGESAVLRWVKRGVPAEVTKARTSQPPASSK